jgi:hypothetical protein
MSTHELIGGICRPCNRPNALSYKPAGNCEIATCSLGYHPDGKSCKDDILDCTGVVPHADKAVRSYDLAKGAYGACMVESCLSGYHVASNACVADETECKVQNGKGYQEWDFVKNKWGDCVVTYCDPGYTFDKSETNESKPCGQCANKFGVMGEVAASGYTAGCDIAACMYQGERYNLENNECVPICTGNEDDTGIMSWDSSAKKCIRQCKPGYTSW